MSTLIIVESEIQEFFKESFKIYCLVLKLDAFEQSRWSGEIRAVSEELKGYAILRCRNYKVVLFASFKRNSCYCYSFLYILYREARLQRVVYKRFMSQLGNVTP